MPAFKDITGLRFGRLVVVERAPDFGDKRVRWRCRCDCGSGITTRGDHLKNGESVSCGCFNAEAVKTRFLRHGHAKRGAQSSMHRRWAQMKDRCLNPNNPQWKDYGERGINCQKWLVFETWLADVIAEIGWPAPGMTLDRINNDGNYEPGNIRWATRWEQAQNRRPRRRRT